MTSQGPPDEPAREPSNGPGADFVTEQELDEVLSQAHLLVDKLSTEIRGVGNDAVPPTGHEVMVQQHDGGSKELDDQLEQLQHLVQTTQAQLGAPEEDGAPRESAGDAAGDQNREGSNTREAANERDSSEEPSKHFVREDTSEVAASVPFVEPTRLRPGVVGTGTIGLLGASRTPAEENGPQPPADASTHDSLRSPSGNSGQTRIRQLLQSAGERLSPAVLTCGAHVVRALEWFDLPFGAISGGVRRALGWLAIATAGMSFAVYVLSLFM